MAAIHSRDWVKTLKRGFNRVAVLRNMRPRDKQGWRVPRPGTIAAEIYSMAKNGLKAREIARGSARTTRWKGQGTLIAGKSYVGSLFVLDQRRGAQ